MNKSKRVLLIAFWILLILSITAITYIKDLWRLPSSSVAVTSFGLCDGIDIETNKPIWNDDEVEQGSRSFTICGYLVSEIPRNFYVVIFDGYTGDVVLDYYPPVLEEGYFTIDIPVSSGFPEGEYVLALYQGRRIVQQVPIIVQ